MSLVKPFVLRLTHFFVFFFAFSFSVEAASFCNPFRKNHRTRYHDIRLRDKPTYHQSDKPISHPEPYIILTEEALQKALNLFKNSPKDRLYTTQEQEDFILYLRTLPEQERIDDALLHNKIQHLLLTVTESNSVNFFLHKTIDNIKCNLRYTINTPEEEELEKLLSTLKKQEMIVDQSFCDFLVNIPELIFHDFCVNANIFFSNLNKAQNIRFFASMFHKDQIYIYDFSSKDDQEIAFIADLASSTQFQNFASTYSNENPCPYFHDKNNILAWPQWKDYNNNLDTKLFKTFSIYHSVKGRPEISDVIFFIHILKKPKFKPIFEGIQKYIKYTLNETQKIRLFTLIETLIDKDMTIEKTFSTIFQMIPQEIFDAFCTKANYFFQKLNFQIKDTKILTNILGNCQEHINDFISRDDEELAFLASHDLLQSFSVMYHGKGLPKKQEVVAIIDWQEWKTESGEFNLQLFTCFSSMYYGKGLPTQEDVQYILSLSQFKMDDQFNFLLFKTFSTYHSGKGRPEISDVIFFIHILKEPKFKPIFEGIQKYIKYTLNETQKIRLFTLIETLIDKDMTIEKTFSTIFQMIPQEIFDAFCTKANYFFQKLNFQIKDTKILTNILGNCQEHINDFISRDDEELAFLASHNLLQSFSSMCNSKGLPKKQEVVAIIDWQEWKTESGKLNLQLFTCFSSMYYGKGLPKKQDVIDVLSWQEWQTKSGEFNSQLFTCFSSMYYGKGLPKKQDVIDVLSWQEWQTKSGEFNLQLFTCFSSMYYGKGLPTQEDVQNILDWPQFKMDGKFHLPLFKFFAASHNSKGCPSIHEVENFLVFQKKNLYRQLIDDIQSHLSYELNPDQEEALQSLFKTLNDKEIKIKPSFKNPFKVLKEEDFNDFCENANYFFQHLNLKIKDTRPFTGMIKIQKHINDFILRSKGELAYLASHDLLQSFSSMYHGKGLPKQKDVQDVLSWQEWKTESGEFNKDLFKSISTMYSGKGFPIQEDVQYILSLS